MTFKEEIQCLVDRLLEAKRDNQEQKIPEISEKIVRVIVGEGLPRELGESFVSCVLSS